MLKRTTLASSAVAILLLGACDSGSSITGTAVGAEVRPNAALVSQTNEQDFPYNWTGRNPCNQTELVTLNGTSHVVMHSSFDMTGGLHLNSHFISEATGFGVGVDEQDEPLEGSPVKEYQARADDRYMNQVPGLTAVWKETHRMQVRGPTRADDFFVHFVLQVTFNAKGVPTATVDKMDVRCNS